MSADGPLSQQAAGLIEALGRSGLSWESSRSDGPGGQNVNKRNTRATLRVQLQGLEAMMDPRCFQRLLSVAGSRVTRSGELVIHGDEHRSIHLNQSACLKRLTAMIEQALALPAMRRPTRPSRGSKQKRLLAKRHRGQVKRLRDRPEELE